MDYVVWDVETTITRHLKRAASPFFPGNFVVASGWKRKGGSIVGEYFGRDAKPFNWFTKLLDGTDLLVGQNIKFDILHAVREPQNLEAWMAFVARGGNVWDCQIGEYLLQGMRPMSQQMAMDDLVDIYGGDKKIDEVKILWSQGVDTTEINPDLLMRYLCGTREGEWREREPEHQQHGDIGNTELIFRGQLQKARKTGQLKSIMLNMGSLLCTIEMERNGMRVDKDLGMRIAAELKDALERETAELKSFLPDDLPFEFKWSNRYHLSPLIFGGQVKYQQRVVKTDPNTGEPEYFQKDETHYIVRNIHTGAEETVAPEVWESLQDDARYERVRFASGKNAGEIKTKKVKVADLGRGPKTALRDFYYEFPRKAEPKPEWASSTEGLFCVDADVIEALGTSNIKFLKSLAAIAKMAKDLGTYYFTVDPKTGLEKGMLTLVDVDGIVHHSINHTRTVTARFSSSDPNLQNVSKGEMAEDGSLKSGSAVKTTFVSRFENGQIVQSDFTSLEVFVQAILTLCPNLISDLQAGLDMHVVRVSQKEGVSYEDAFLKCKGDKSRGIDPLPEWAKKRTEAKSFSFQRAYGAGADAIAASTGMAKSDVEALIKAENERYPELAAYNAAKSERIKASRRPTSAVEEHPDLPGVYCQYGRGFSVTPDKKVYSYQERPIPKKMYEGRLGRWRKQGADPNDRPSPQSFSPTEIANYEVQGAGGEWAKAAMWLAIRAFYARGNFGGRALLVNQVHDALYGDMDPTVLDEASALLHACMLAASDFMEYWFEWHIPVPVPSVTVHGDNMMQEREFGAGFDTRADELRAELRKQYMSNYTPSFLN